MSSIMTGFKEVFVNENSGAVDGTSLPKEFEIVLVRDRLDRIQTAYWTCDEEVVTRDNIEWYVPSKLDDVADTEIDTEVTDWMEYKGQIV